MSKRNGETLFDKKAVAQRFNVSPATINRLLRAGAIGFTRIGGQIRFRESDLANYLARRSQSARTA